MFLQKIISGGSERTLLSRDAKLAVIQMLIVLEILFVSSVTITMESVP